MSRATQALVDLAALQHNLRRVQQLAPQSQIMAIIKADAYGHSMVRIAHCLAQQVNAFGVARLDEAIGLREAGISLPIVLLEGFLEEAELTLIVQYQLSVVIHHHAQLEILEHLPVSAPIRLWLKVDSGMHRLGFAPATVADVWQRLQATAWAAGPIRLMTHLANADDCEDPLTLLQLATFDAAISGMHSECSIANSAAILAWPQTHVHWVRPGLMLYGVSPFPNRTAQQDGLKPVMTLRTKLIAIHQRKQGDTIGYGASWCCPVDMTVGVAAIGYGDGYPRHAVAGTPVLVNGQRSALVGRVSMDMISLDLRDQPKARVGDSVVFWGVGLPVEEVARYASTIPYELLCGVARRVKSVEVNALAAHSAQPMDKAG